VNLSNVFSYVTHNSESIIQWLFFSIMGLAALVVGRQIFFKPSSDDGASHSAAPLPGEIQEMLTRILEQTGKLQNVSVSAGSTEGAPAEMLHQLELLKKDLQTREEEISRLQKTGGGGDSKELGTRVKELEAKLEEYSILEDDIADLSLYKEENVRLKSDLEKLRAGGAAPAAASEAPAPAAIETASEVAEELPLEAVAEEPAPAPEIAEPAPAATATPVVNDDLVAEFAQAVNTNAAPTGGAPLDLPQTGDPMTDFENTVKADKGLPPDAAPAPAAAAAKAPARDDDSHSGDLFAEFSEEDQDESELDTDKMMEEMAALISSEAKDDSSSALDENVDTDKMLEEAKNFTKTS
jgi:hypothetical protein